MPDTYDHWAICSTLRLWKRSGIKWFYEVWTIENWLLFIWLVVTTIYFVKWVKCRWICCQSFTTNEQTLEIRVLLRISTVWFTAQVKWIENLSSTKFYVKHFLKLIIKHSPDKNNSLLSRQNDSSCYEFVYHSYWIPDYRRRSLEAKIDEWNGDCREVP